MSNQDLRTFLSDYVDRFPEDVLSIGAPLSASEDVAALVWELATRDRHQMLRIATVAGSGYEVVTNMFASRDRIERMQWRRPRAIAFPLRGASRRAEITARCR